MLSLQIVAGTMLNKRGQLTLQASHESQIVIDVDMKTRKSRMLSDPGLTDPMDEEYTGQVMQPLILQPLKDYKLTEGQDATFFCKVAGVPRPKVSGYSARSRSMWWYMYVGYAALCNITVAINKLLPVYMPVNKEL